MTTYVVRLILDFAQAQRIDTEGFIDLLAKSGTVVVHRNDKTGVCMDLPFPVKMLDGREDPFVRQTISMRWAREQAARWTGHGFNAVAAPEFVEQKECGNEDD